MRSLNYLITNFCFQKQKKRIYIFPKFLVNYYRKKKRRNNSNKQQLISMIYVQINTPLKNMK